MKRVLEKGWGALRYSKSLSSMKKASPFFSGALRNRKNISTKHEKSVDEEWPLRTLFLQGRLNERLYEAAVMICLLDEHYRFFKKLPPRSSCFSGFTGKERLSPETYTQRDLAFLRTRFIALMNFILSQKGAKIWHLVFRACLHGEDISAQELSALREGLEVAGNFFDLPEEDRS